MYYSDLSKEQKQQVLDQSGYDQKDLRVEDPFFVPSYDWEDYARQQAEDLGLINSEGQWPTYHIDWSAAADELMKDYTTVTIDGQDYLFRSW